MTWLAVPGIEIRRRAVVAGRIAEPAGSARTPDLALELVETASERRFACHPRGRGFFFCLDVPPGRYTLESGAGADVKPRRVVVPDYADDARMPVVRLDVEVVPPVAPSPARPN